MNDDKTPVTVPNQAIPNPERVEVKDILGKIDAYEFSLPEVEPEMATEVAHPPAIPEEPQETTEEIVRRVLAEHYGTQEEERLQNVIERPRRSWFWIKNSNGQSSASITFLYIAFWVTTMMFVFGHIGEINIGENNISFNDFDSTAAAVYYVPLMMLYFKRREFESDKPGRPGLLELALTRNNQNNNG